MFCLKVCTSIKISILRKNWYRRLNFLQIKQVGGEYEKTYKLHLDDILNGKYDYIVHNYTGSKIIDNLVLNKRYKIIKSFSDNYSNIGEVLILRKNILSK